MLFIKQYNGFIVIMLLIYLTVLQNGRKIRTVWLLRHPGKFLLYFSFVDLAHIEKCVHFFYFFQCLKFLL